MSKLRIAIIYEDDRIYCQIEPSDFRQLFKSLLEVNDIDKTLDKVEEKIREMSLRI
jgi:hypothetical protein